MLSPHRQFSMEKCIAVPPHDREKNYFPSHEKKNILIEECSEKKKLRAQ